MRGLMVFRPPDTVVGKQSEYKSRNSFLLAAVDEDEGYLDTLKKKYGRGLSEEDVYEALVRYYPKGTESSAMEFGQGEGVYMFVDKDGAGAFKVWCV